MKKIIVSTVAVFLLTATHFANAGAVEQPKIDDIKAQILQALDKEVAMMNQIRDKESGIMAQFKTCIQGMKNEADFNNCNNAKNEAYKKMKLELEKAYLDNQKKAIANQEKKLNAELQNKK